MSDVLEVVIVVVTYNSEQVIDACLDSLATATTRLQVEVVVVDNGSADATVDRVTKRDGITLVRSTNIGYSGGINLGVRSASSAGAILILNPDVVLHPGCLDPLVDALEVRGTGIAVPRIVNADGTLGRGLRREPTLSRALGLGATGRPAFAEYVDDPNEYLTSHVVDWAVGAAMLVSRECYDAVGGWDESYFLYSEETDFCLRSRDLGYATRFEPAAAVTHAGGHSGRDVVTHTMQVVNRIRLYRRRHGWLASWAYFCVTILAEISWALRDGAYHLSAIGALLIPSRRPAALGCSDRVMPR